MELQRRAAKATGGSVIGDSQLKRLGDFGLEEQARNLQLDGETAKKFNSALDSIKNPDDTRRFFDRVLLASTLQEEGRTLKIDHEAMELAEKIVSSSKMMVVPPAEAVVAAASEVARTRGDEYSAADILGETVKNPNVVYPIPQTVSQAFGLKKADTAGETSLEKIANKIYAGLRYLVTGNYSSDRLEYDITGGNLVKYVIDNALAPDAVDKELRRHRHNQDITKLLERIAEGENPVEMKLKRVTVT